MSGGPDERRGGESRISLVVAMARNRVIGRAGGLPWHLPADLARFRVITMGKPIVMGRHTHASIGRALPGRRNMVLTRHPARLAADCEAYPSLDAALAAASPAEVMIVGGAALYAEALPRAMRIYLTMIEAEVEGDVLFPALADDEWSEVAASAHAADARHLYAYSFRVLERISRTLPAAPT